LGDVLCNWKGSRFYNRSDAASSFQTDAGVNVVSPQTLVLVSAFPTDEVRHSILRFTIFDALMDLAQSKFGSDLSSCLLTAILTATNCEAPDNMHQASQSPAHRQVARLSPRLVIQFVLVNFPIFSLPEGAV
jgi:hypothetical protein